MPLVKAGLSFKRLSELVEAKKAARGHGPMQTSRAVV